MGTHSGHGQQICEFGVVHSRCRCADETTRWIKCPDPKTCQEKTGVDPKYTPKHKKSVYSDSREARLDP